MTATAAASAGAFGVNTIELDALEAWTVRVLQHNGLSESDARWVANNLTFAEARGVVTHGLMRLPIYVERIRNGGINKGAVIHVDHDLGALVILDADHAPGAASAVYATDLAVQRARRLGIGCVIARRANHFGITAYYTNRIADADLLGIAICNTESVMCAPAGGRPVLGTNPLAVAVPLPAERRPQLDMATTTASHGRLLLAKQAGSTIPLGWAVDAAGRATDSPAAGLAGALLPSGGPKGFGIAFAIDAILAIAGVNVSPEVSALHGDPTRPQNLGHAFIALRADLVGPLEEYRARIDRLLDAIHGSAVDGCTALPLAPGEPELARAREINGRIAFSKTLMTTLARLADTAGVPLPEPVPETT